MWSIITKIAGGLIGPLAKEARLAAQDWHNARTEAQKSEAAQRMNQVNAWRDDKAREKAMVVLVWPLAVLLSAYVLYFLKLIVWDKLLEWGTTEPLSADLKELFNYLLMWATANGGLLVFSKRK